VTTPAAASPPSRLRLGSDQLEVWRAQVCDGLWDADTAVGRAESFAADLELQPLGAGLLCTLDVGGSAGTIRRDRRRVAGARLGIGVGLSLIRRGHAIIKSRGVEQELGPGDVSLISASEPFEKIFSSDYREHFFVARRRTVEELLGGSLGGDQPRVARRGSLARVLADHVAALHQHGRDLPQDVGENLGRSVVNLMGAVFAEPGAAHEARQRSLRAIHRDRVDRYLELHLHDPELTPPRIAMDNKISLRYLHALFAGGESVCETIMTRRLARCHEALSSPAHASRSITDIAFAWGWNSTSHFCRLYKARYGVTPSVTRGVHASATAARSPHRAR
jgi:AraC-like DNA-binding protein